jgi:hypothetical protein
MASMRSTFKDTARERGHDHDDNNLHHEPSRTEYASEAVDRVGGKVPY